MPGSFVLLGCGYAGSRVAVRLAAGGHRVIATSRDGASLRDVPVEAHTLDLTRPETIEPLAAIIEPGSTILHSIPILPPAIRPAPLLAPILARAGRLIYLSTTGVYGPAGIVDEHTPTHPATERAQLRLDEENDCRTYRVPLLILRPAAIYGPGRGVHVAVRTGRHRLWGDGFNYISRIHIDDLAVITERALHSDLTGVYPVADREPCPAIEITRFCANLLGVAVPTPSGHAPPGETRSANRRVDGSAVCRLLGIELMYPSYRTGIPAALAAEASTINPLTGRSS